MAALSKQQNLAVNTNKSQLYIEDDTTPLSYNYKTDQWSSITDYAGIGFYSVDSGLNIGLARISGNAVDLQQPESTDPASEAIITTGEAAFSDGSRRTITGVRPLLTGADANVSIIYRDKLNPGTNTNYILQSEDFSTTWSGNAATINTNQTQAPDGQVTADYLTGDGTANAVFLDQSAQDIGTVPATVLFSVYGKYVDADARYLKIAGVSTNNSYMSFDTLTGNIVSVGTINIANYGVETSIYGFFRGWITINVASDTTPLFRISQVESDGTTGVQGTAAASVAIWGAMVDVRDSIGGYIKTTTTTASSDVETTTESTINSRSGIAAFRVDSRYHRIKFRVSGGFDTILGADVEFVQTGRT